MGGVGIVGRESRVIFKFTTANIVTLFDILFFFTI